MEDLIRISAFWSSACEGHFGVFFATFSSWSNLLTPDGGITLSLVPNLATDGGFILVKN
jgi:hypothetical protein